MPGDAFTAGVKPGGLTSGAEIRILLCYLIRTAGPVQRDTLEDALMEEELVNYFELCAALKALPALTLFVIFGVYLWSNLRDAKSGMAENRETRPKGRTVSRRQMMEKLFLFVLGIAAIVTGSQLLINYGSELALLMGVPASIIGVTMVAIGTSLPELVTTLTAIAKKEASMSVGNIIGANVIDLTMILPVCSAVSGGALTIGAQTTALDMPACLLLCCVAVIPPLVAERFYRWQGMLMLGLYAGYVVLLVT